LFFFENTNSFFFFFLISSSISEESVEQMSSSTEAHGCSFIVVCLKGFGLAGASSDVSECDDFGLLESTVPTFMSCDSDRVIGELFVATEILLLLILRGLEDNLPILLYPETESSGQVELSIKEKLLITWCGSHRHNSHFSSHHEMNSGLR
jgi:hypothetical protein